MNARQVYQALRPLVDEALLRAGRAAGIIPAFLEFFEILVNNNQAATGASTVPGTTIVYDPVSITPIGDGLVNVTATAGVAAIAADVLSFTLVRATVQSGPFTAFGPVVEASADANGKCTVSLNYIDDSAVVGTPYYYGIRVTDMTGGHDVSFQTATSASVVMQQTL